MAKVELRAYPKNPLYYGRLQSPMPALSGQNRPRRSFGYACGNFAPAALALGFSLGLMTSLFLG